MRTTRLGLLIAAVATLAVACSDDDGTLRADTESIDSSAPESPGSGNGDATGDDATSDTTDGEGSGSDSGEVLGSSTATLRANALDDRSTPVRIDVLRLERHGDLVELSLVLTNEAPPTDSDPQNFLINSLFGANYDASGIGLVDGAAQKLYLPVLDSDETCLCSGELGASDVQPGGTMTIDATYGGVPDDVDAIDVRVPNFPTIAEVPVG